MKRLHRIILPVAIAAALAPLSGMGCGSSDSGNETSASLSRSQFLKEADQLCHRRLEEKDAAVEAGFKRLPPAELSNPSPEDLEEIGQDTLPPMEALAEELNELGIPADDQATIEKIIGELEDGLGEAQADPSLLAESDPFQEAGAAAKTYGLKACNL
jgi:hypothetical protein